MSAIRHDKKLKVLLVPGAVVLVLVCLWAFTRSRVQTDVLRTAYGFANGGGYCELTDTGVPEAVLHDGTIILRPSKGGSYCSGFTFLVAIRVAADRGLLKQKEAYEVKRFQREWYGATNESRLRQAAMAVESLGIGRQVDPRDAEPGDFVVIHRVGGSGHSAIFLEWIREGDVVVGLRYRSSQPVTGGIGDSEEYFATSGYTVGCVDPARFYVARLRS